jgi:hypothetical protein
MPDRPAPTISTSTKSAPAGVSRGVFAAVSSGVSAGVTPMLTIVPAEDKGGNG